MVDFLFICKENYSYGSEKVTFHGLLNSSDFISRFLNEKGIKSKTEMVKDSNDIDSIVTIHNPSAVVIEALWVTPEKMQELVSLHPNRLWIIRVHSKSMFLAEEGIAINWIKSYPQNVIVCPNAKSLVGDL